MNSSQEPLTNDEIIAVLRDLLSRREFNSVVGARSFPRDITPIARDFSSNDLADLRPYVVSMRQGTWDTSGIFNSTPGDVDAIFSQTAKAALESLGGHKKLKIVLYAHGGLVSEKNGLSQAQFHINWWNQSAADGIYPIYFIWKTGLGETIAQLLGLAGGASRELAATAREWISDPIVAAIARRLGGEGVWSGMKWDAEQAVLGNGVGTYVAQRLKEFCEAHAGQVELHAIGHSAGAVFHSHFIPACTAAGNPHFTTTNFMAPAVRVDTFMNQLTMVHGGGGRTLKPDVGQLALFTMKKDFEKQDNCINIYHQSLLYLIYHAFENVDKTPILGLEESLRGVPDLARLMGLTGTPAPNANVIWSKSPSTTGCSATQAIHHGDFSSDAATLESILRRILNRCDGERIQPFPGMRAMRDIWDIWAPPDDLPGFGIATPVPNSGPQPHPTNSTGSVPPVSGLLGKRRALCVGIDAYASPNGLTGCVHDARTWANLLQKNGFDIHSMIDEQATHENITGALRQLIRSSSAGDVLVFTYSGHGTVVPDTSGRTVDGVEEAMVPVDFSSDNPKLLMDFDLKDIIDTLPAAVNLTCFVDCCHSGTILRLFVGAPSSNATGADERARFMTLTPDEVEAVQQYQGRFRATSRGNVAGGQALMREVAFAACRPEEVALEVNGQGDFTRLATSLLTNNMTMTNEQFQTAVTQAFGANPRQHPNLDCAPTARKRGLLQPL